MLKNENVSKKLAKLHFGVESVLHDTLNDKQYRELLVEELADKIDIDNKKSLEGEASLMIDVFANMMTDTLIENVEDKFIECANSLNI